VKLLFPLLFKAAAQVNLFGIVIISDFECDILIALELGHPLMTSSLRTKGVQEYKIEFSFFNINFNPIK